MTTPTNHWKLGLFVVVGSMLGLTAIIYLGARTWQKPAIEYRSYLDEAVTGLDVGSPVRFRGVTIGSVSAIAIAPDHRHVELRYGIAVDAAEGLLAHPKQSGQARMIVPPGLRAQLGSQGVTGVKYVLLDFFDPELNPPPELPFPVPENYIPSTPSTLKNLESSVVRAVDQIPIATEQLATVMTEVKALVASVGHEKLPQRLTGTLARVDSVLSLLDQRLRELPVSRLSREASATLANFNATLLRLQGVLQRIDSDRGVMRSVERAADSMGDMAADARDVTGQLDQTLREVSAAASAIRDLATALDRDPDMLLKGKSKARSR